MGKTNRVKGVTTSDVISRKNSNTKSTGSKDCAESLNRDGLTTSNSWLQSFCKRNNTIIRSMYTRRKIIS